jgi:hypothetical protein
MRLVLLYNVVLLPVIIVFMLDSPQQLLNANFQSNFKFIAYCFVVLHPFFQQ